MSVSMKVKGFKDVQKMLKATGEDVQHAGKAGAKAAAVHMAEALYDNSPWDTGAMANSIGVGEDQEGEFIVEQVAPYTIFVDLQQAHFSGTYAREEQAAMRVAVEVGNKALKDGTGPRNISSRFPEQGQYTPGNYKK